jgi:hypothetical protein
MVKAAGTARERAPIQISLQLTFPLKQTLDSKNEIVMLKTGTILAELYQSVTPEAKNRKVIDLRIGLGYIGVRLDNDST